MSIISAIKAWKVKRLIIRKAVLQAKYNETSALMKRLERFPAYYPDSMVKYAGEIEKINVKLYRYGVNVD